MNGRLRQRLLLTLVFLLVCAVLPSVGAPAFAQSASAGLTQEFVCWPIAQGDTAVGLARRLTGDAATAYRDTFQIRDPSRRMFVPKSQYRRLMAGWQACVATGSVKGRALAPAPGLTPASAAIVPEEPPITSTPLTSTPAPLALASAGSPSYVVFAAKIGAVVLFILSMCAAAAGSLAPRPIPPPMQRAGEAFVNAFARPLADLSAGAPPIRARLRFVHRKQQLEISIAPGPGRRYPNLVDHKRNVEYDVTRVMRQLGARFVVSDRLRTAGKWVVVPIRLADLKQTGVK